MALIGQDGPLDYLELAEGLGDETPPFLTAQDPAPDAVDVPVDSNIVLTIDDVFPGVDLTTVVISIDSGAGFITVYTGSAFQPGFAGSVTPDGFSYDFVINPDVDFPSNTLISVRVVARDYDYNLLDTTYTFTIVLGATAEPHPDFDTFRGGKEIVVRANVNFLDTSADIDFTTLQSIPAGWTQTLTGTGSHIFSPQGLRFRTRGLTSSSAQLRTTNAYDSFDAKLLLEMRAPRTSTSVLATAFRFQVWIDASNYFSIDLLRDENVSDDLIFARASIVRAGQTNELGSTLLSTREVELRIVRHEGYVFAFANDTAIGSASRFGSTSAALLFSVAHGASGAPIETWAKNLTMRSHALINGRLLTNKKELSPRRLLGNVPAATLAEVGFRPIIVFGPWGASSSEDGFEYQLPTPKTIGRGSPTAILFSYENPNLRD